MHTTRSPGLLPDLFHQLMGEEGKDKTTYATKAGAEMESILEARLTLARTGATLSGGGGNPAGLVSTSKAMPRPPHVNKYNIARPAQYHTAVREFLREWIKGSTSNRDWYTTLYDVWMEQGMDNPTGLSLQAEWAMVWDPACPRVTLPREVMADEARFTDVLGKWAQLRMDPKTELELAYKSYDGKLGRSSTSTERSSSVQGLIIKANELMDPHKKDDLEEVEVGLA